MNYSQESTLKTSLGSALVDSLCKRFPHTASSPHIEDIVNALLASLSRGEIYLDFSSESKAPNEIKSDGWPNEHYKALLDSGWLKLVDGPIVLVNNFLSLRRWHIQMKDVTEVLITKSNKKLKDGIKISKGTSQIFESKLNKEQSIAVEKITTQSLMLVTGGPGTGKTSTVAQMLLKALSLKPSLKIGLAAPTGKATRRLQESLQDSLKDLNVDARQKLSKVTCSTIHKWLQAKETQFIKNASNPIQLDLLVVDEMSMVDLTLMKGLIEALPNNCQLVLVGDCNQLPPVGSGAIWHFINQDENIQKKFINCSINLSKVYRNRGDLLILADLLNSKGLHAFWEKVKDLTQSSNVSLHLSNKGILPNYIVNKIKVHYKKIKDIAKRISSNTNYIYQQGTDKKDNYLIKTSNELFQCLEELIVLCPRRYGLWSVDHINRALLGNLIEENVSLWPEGVPIICGSNQPELGIANGDLGITVGEGESRYLLFRVMDDNHCQVPKFIHPSRLKNYDGAFAMTIHKAQGSEAKHVIMFWPNQLQAEEKKSNLNNDYDKRLLYTGITRAKESLDVLLAE